MLCLNYWHIINTYNYVFVTCCVGHLEGGKRVWTWRRKILFGSGLECNCLAMFLLGCNWSHFLLFLSSISHHHNRSNSRHRSISGYFLPWKVSSRKGRLSFPIALGFYFLLLWRDETQHEQQECSEWFTPNWVNLISW